MPDLKIFSSDDLVDATVKQRQETYYLVTEDFLNSLKNKTILSDIFLFVASLAWGGYASSIITLNSIPEKDKQLLSDIIFQLKTLRTVLLAAGFIFTLLTCWLVYLSYHQVKKLKHANITVGNGRRSGSKSKKSK